MAEDTTIIVEEEILNNINEEAQEESEEQEQPKTFTLEEVEEMKKKMQSDSEKGVQKLISEKKDYDTALSELSKIAEDKTYLVDLFMSNEKVAKIILEKFYEWITIDQFKESIGYEEDLTNPRVRERLINLEAQKRVNQKTIADKKAAFIEKLKMSEDEQKDFEDAFAERMQLRTFNINDIDIHLEKAYREIINEDSLKQIKTQETIGKTMATWEWKSWGSDTKKDTLNSEISDFLGNYFN